MKNKLKFVIPILILGALVLIGVVFSLDKFAEAEEATYDSCVWVCGVNRDFVNCLRKCETNYKSSAMACPGDCWTTIGQEILYECGNVCGTELAQCTDKCYKDWDNTLKGTYYAPETGRAAKPIPGGDEWEVECRGGYITRTYDYSGCVAECKEEFVAEEPVGEEEPKNIFQKIWEKIINFFKWIFRFIPISWCGNGKCEAGEDWETCPQDCELR